MVDVVFVNTPACVFFNKNFVQVRVFQYIRDSVNGLRFLLHRLERRQCEGK